MAALPVEAVLIVFYGPEAHHVTYGRQVRGGGYTKDYIQLSRLPAFIDWAERLFPRPPGAEVSVPLTYEWPGGSRAGDFVYKSADRPHLKWDTRDGAPLAWRMTPSPNESTPETIPGNPGLDEFAAAEAEYQTLVAKGAGQPYLVAVKLRDQPGKLHVRAYLDGASSGFSFAELDRVPTPIVDLARQTTQRRALAWQLFDSRGVAPTSAAEAAIESLLESADVAATTRELSSVEKAQLSNYLRDPGHGLFFDPSRNHDAWTLVPALADELLAAAPAILDLLAGHPPVGTDDDIAAENLATDSTEVEELRGQIESRDYSVLDATASVKTRGSAQRVFADAVKANYGYRCAVTGITTRRFLVASHIVPWSEDQSIRLDPSNGICLSLMVDRAFEAGYLRIEDDLSLRVDRERIGDDVALLDTLAPYDGQVLSRPTADAPLVQYLTRRRELVDRAT